MPFLISLEKILSLQKSLNLKLIPYHEKTTIYYMYFVFNHWF